MEPHGGQPIMTAGAPPGRARGVVILVHGRNAGPANILDLVPRLDRPDFHFVAPAAADRTWYPHSFMADVASNEPGRSSGLEVIERLVDRFTGAGLPTRRIVLAGFSQGACLAAEAAVQHPRRYGGVLVFSGGLIGPAGTRWPTTGSFDGTPVFLGCSDADSHVPEVRVRESAEVFTRLAAVVTARIYPGMGHLVSDDEIQLAQQILDSVTA